MKAAKARSELIMEIISGELSKTKFEEKMRALADNYGEDAFCPYIFKKKEGPWKKEYYEKLEKKAISGAGSEEFIRHLYEVKCSVEGKRFGIKEVVKQVKNFCPIIIGVVILLAAIVAIVVFIGTHKTNKGENLETFISQIPVISESETE